MSLDVTEPVTSERRRRPRLVLIVAAVLALAIAVVVAIVFTQNPDRPLAELRIRDERVSVKARGVDFVPGVEGQALGTGNAVRTNDRGQAQVDFFDGSLTRLDASTTFVVRELKDGPQGRRISLRLDAGRTWNRVERLTSSEDRYELSGGNAVATVRGTTFIADGRQAPIWYYIGQDGETQVSLPPQEPFLLRRNECVRVDEDGMRQCTDHEFEALMDDWVGENQGVDGLAAVSTPTPSPTPTPTPALTAAPGRRGGSVSTPDTPAPDATRRPRVRNTEEPNEDDDRRDDDRTDPPTDPPTEPPKEPPTTDDHDEDEAPPTDGGGPAS